MKKLLPAVAAFMLLFAACKSKGKASWPESERKAFLDNCEREANPRMGGKAKSYCNCMQVKIENKYPRPEDALKIGMKDMMDMARDCAK